MSLWTPGGEHPVDRGGSSAGSTGIPQSGSPGPASGGAGPVGGGAGGLGGQELSPEQEVEAQQMAAEMAEVRAQLSEVPAAQVIANHAMGCWELAAIHLSAQPPKFAEAQLAIDAFGALVAVVEGRLGPDEATLNDALAQLRLAFVQMKASVANEGSSDTRGPGPSDLGHGPDAN